MSRLVVSSAILLVAVAVCAHWWAQFTGVLPKYTPSRTHDLIALVLAPLAPFITVKLAIKLAGKGASDVLFWIWVTILAGTNMTVSGIALQAAHTSSRTHAIFSRFLLVLDLLNIFWIVSLFSRDGLYHLWHTDRDYLFASAVFTEMTPHTAVNLLALGMHVDQYVPAHLGISGALIINLLLAYRGLKIAYTPVLREKYHKPGGERLELDTTQYEKLRKTVE